MQVGSEIKGIGEFGDGLSDLIDLMDSPIETISLPWARLNSLVGGGLRTGEVTVLAGTPGSGKSHLAVDIYMHAVDLGVSAVYLPLEDKDRDALRRVLAHMRNDWSIMEESVYGREKLREAFTAAMSDDPQQRFAKYSAGILANPRQIYKDGAGTARMTNVYSDRMIDWVSRASSKRKLIIIDPISMVDYASSSQWKDEETLIKSIAAIASASNVHVMIVLHLKKRDRAGEAPTIDCLQGSAGYQRFAHGILLSWGHEIKDSRISKGKGVEDHVFHRRSLEIGKCRNGRGAHIQFALDFSENGPVTVEHGTILKKGK